VSACLALGRSLGLTTVAEGVETGAQAEWLQRAECDAVQGYFFARPLDPHRISSLLRSAEHLAGLPLQLPRARQAEPDPLTAGSAT
jgi:EAL domain-containing protein (putative c-di-GMP-specific phosphodiesterase class I)